MRAMADAGEPPPNLCPLCGHPTSAASSSGSASPPSAAAARQPLMMRKPPPEAPPAVVRVEIGDEAAALREALARQQAALGELQAELDAERGAAAGAASEAMTMILRLQREKAEAMMEARQFRRYAEEKMSHDAAELASLEEAIAKRDATAAAMRSVPSQSGLGGGTPQCGLSIPSSPRVSSTPRHASTPSSVAAAAAAASGGYYPALLCFNDMLHPPTASEADALDVQTPRDHLARLSHRVNMLERRAVAAPPTSTTTPIIRVAPGSAFQRNPRAFSDADSLDFCDGEFFPDDVDCGASDRVYTVDAIHGRGGGVPMAVPEGSYCGGTPVGSVSDCCSGGGGGAPWGEDEEMRRLSARLRALEADRENMRQAILSMGAEKAQVVLLKEIAQQLCKDGPPSSLPAVTVGQHYFKGAAPPAVTVTVPRPQRPMVMHRMVLKSQPKTSLFATVVKWVASIVWWRRKSARIKHPIGQCGNNVGLLLLLDKSFKAAGDGRQKPPKRV